MNVNSGKASGVQATGRTVLVIRELEAAIARAKRNRATPGKRHVAALDGAAVAVDRLGITVKLVRVAAYVGTHALAGLQAIPATGHNRPHLNDAERSHH